MMDAKEIADTVAHIKRVLEQGPPITRAELCVLAQADALKAQRQEIERLRGHLKKISAAANRGVLNMSSVYMIGDWARAALAPVAGPEGER